MAVRQSGARGARLANGTCGRRSPSPNPDPNPNPNPNPNPDPNPNPYPNRVTLTLTLTLTPTNDRLFFLINGLMHALDLATYTTCPVALTQCNGLIQ